jgi:hypothetical protein
MFFGLLQNKKFKLRWFLSGVEVSARIAPWLAVIGYACHIVFLLGSVLIIFIALQIFVKA